MGLIYEICIDSVEGALAAEGAGAQRVELCAGLFEGGITPSLGMITSVREAAGSIKTHVMIRPRGGDFIYSEHEVAVMERDVAAARDAGAHGLVIGALTAEGRVDRPTTARLMRAAGDLPITFHRAFDMTRDPFAALEDLVALGVARVLTSGQDSSALEGAPLIARLVARAGDRIIVMPGGGIGARNIARILETTRAREVHVAAPIHRDSPATHRNPDAYMGGALRPPEYARTVTSAEAIAGIITAAHP